MTQKNILIIDDEAGIRKSFSLFLTEEGYNVDTAENGQIGLDKINAGGVDLVLLDLKMPVLDGVGVLTGLKGLVNPPPVMVVTAFAQSYFQQLKALADEGVDFELLAKPIDGDQLIEAVHAYF